ncbi:hypothetical protein HanRHA438_Chr07g0310471 [Helianthus annuus]|uniref:Uncharacterized protein n=1 Tax=Helianthus annuus TaxID=4232 RepID=A0A9K3IM30_HELAN|nr:hypothetical protein HanXRQr2_Chr07g0300271 [Helianthus annuus]KAJ0563520.1 hypothetical protein HanHA89_Chr07g0264091 [Helianthus annuus]KAJ0731613.1 hypothetical protein HanOQP8_Chr07g0254001 [Helianthus annuus]KAJ0908440.1 hypothetical protein HanRHA438_Chr07g0310471 [Helianthus annuus]
MMQEVRTVKRTSRREYAWERRALNVKILFRPRRMIKPCQEPNTPNKASAFCLFCFSDM